jgi:hypothetical protein
MSKLKLGTKDVCKPCGEPIEYIGPYWRHIDSSPRRPAMPTKFAEKKGAK